MALLDPELALAEVLGCVIPLPPEKVAIQESLDRHITRDISARRKQPAADNSAMDGYAVYAADLEGVSGDEPATLKLVGRVRAGDSPNIVAKPGEVVRIFTGALVPDWADAVVMQEQTQPISNGDGSLVEFYAAAKVGQNIRRAGEEYGPGDCLLRAGSRIREATIGLLAGDGTTEVDVYGRSRVAVIGTGNELVAPEDAGMNPQSVVDGNTPMLAAAAAALGSEICLIERVGDEAETVAASLRRALEKAHVILTTGGASVGEFDVIPEAWELAGIETRFWKVAIKPGKPLRFGVFRRDGAPDTLVFALPGNPLSALTNFELFVHPAIRGLSGAAAFRRPTLNLPLHSDSKGARDRLWLVRAGICDGAMSVPRRQGSNMLREAAANPLVAQFSPGRPFLEEGTPVAAFIAARDLEGMSLEPYLAPPVTISIEGGSPADREAVLGQVTGGLSSKLRVAQIRVAPVGASATSGGPDCGLVGSLEIPGRDNAKENTRAVQRGLKAFSGEADLVFLLGDGLRAEWTISLESALEPGSPMLLEDNARPGWKVGVSDLGLGGVDPSCMLMELVQRIHDAAFDVDS